MKYLLLLLPLLALSSLQAQPRPYEKTFLIDGFNAAVSSIQATFDGGFIIAGTLTVDDTTNPFPNDTRGFLLRVDAEGDTLWWRQYGTSSENSLISVHQLADSGFIACGYSNRTYGGISKLSDHWLLRTDANGDTLWWRQYGTSNDEELKGMFVLPDGYLLYGSFYSSSYNAYLAKVDTAGTLLWSRPYSDRTSWNAAVPTRDGGYLLVGGASVRRVDSVGKVVWDTTFTKLFFNIQNVIATPDGGFVMAGLNQNKFWLTILKIDSSGHYLWNTGSSQARSGPYVNNPFIIPTPDNGYLIAGFEASDNDQPVLMKTDIVGKPLWMRVYDTNLYTLQTGFRTLTLTPENDIVAAGYSYYVYPRYGTTGVLLMRVDSEGYLVHPPDDSFWNRLRYTGGDAIPALTIDSAGVILASETSNTQRTLLYRSTDDGRTWHDDNGPGYEYRSLITLANGDILGHRAMNWNLAETPEGSGAWRSTDHGVSWSKLDPFPENYTYTFALDRSNTIYALGYDALFRSNDNAAHWDSLTVPRATLRAIAIAPNGAVYLTTDSVGAQGIFRSTDHGTTWSPIGPRNDTGSAYRLSATFVRRNGDLFATTMRENATYHSSDDGETWHRIDSVADLDITTLAFDPQGAIYASVNNPNSRNRGIWRSDDDGATWHHRGDTTFNISRLMVDPRGRLIGTGVGIFRTGTTVASVEKEEHRTAPSLALNVLPNPVAGRTHIRYALPSRSHVSLTIVDPLGRVIATLVDSEQNQGEQSVEWNADASTAGVYYCVLRAGSATEIEPLVVEHR